MHGRGSEVRLPHPQAPQVREGITKLEVQELINKLVESSTPALARRGLSLFGFFALGRKTLASSSAVSYRMLSKLAEKYDVDWDEVFKLSDRQLKVPRKKGCKFKKRQTLALEKIDAEIRQKSRYKDY